VATRRLTRHQRDIVQQLERGAIITKTSLHGTTCDGAMTYWISGGATIRRDTFAAIAHMLKRHSEHRTTGVTSITYGLERRKNRKEKGG